MKDLNKILLICSLLTYTLCKKGIDLSTYTEEFSCLKDAGFDFVIRRAWRSDGTPDPGAPSTIANAWESGFSQVDIYFFPCRDHSA